MFKRALTLIVVVFLIYGCDFLPKKGLSGKAKLPPIKGALLAQVNDWAIGINDFDNQIDALKELFKGRNIDVTSLEFKREYLEDLIRAELLAQEAKVEGLDRDPEIVKAMRAHERTLLSQKLISDLIKDITVTSAEIEKFYEDNKAFFRDPEQRRVSEIVTPTEVQARDILIKILQGENFSSLARARSIADSKDEGGDLGYLVPDPKKKFRKFWEVSFSLGQGEVSSVFQGDDGKYYIIKIVDIKEGKERPLGEVWDDIKEALTVKKKNDKVVEFVEGLKIKAKVIINEDLLR